MASITRPWLISISIFFALTFGVIALGGLTYLLVKDTIYEFNNIPDETFFTQNQTDQKFSTTAPPPECPSQTIDHVSGIYILGLEPTQTGLPRMWYCIHHEEEINTGHLEVVDDATNKIVADVGDVSISKTQLIDFNTLSIPSGSYRLRARVSKNAPLNTSVNSATFYLAPLLIKNDVVSFTSNFPTSSGLTILLSAGQTISDGTIGVKLESVETTTEGPIAHLYITDREKSFTTMAKMYWKEDFDRHLDVRLDDISVADQRIQLLITQSVRSVGY